MEDGATTTRPGLPTNTVPGAAAVAAVADAASAMAGTNGNKMAVAGLLILVLSATAAKSSGLTATRDGATTRRGARGIHGTRRADTNCKPKLMATHWLMQVGDKQAEAADGETRHERAGSDAAARGEELASDRTRMVHTNLTTSTTLATHRLMQVAGRSAETTRETQLTMCADVGWRRGDAAVRGARRRRARRVRRAESRRRRCVARATPPRGGRRRAAGGGRRVGRRPLRRRAPLLDRRMHRAQPRRDGRGAARRERGARKLNFTSSRLREGRISS